MCKQLPRILFTSLRANCFLPYVCVPESSLERKREIFIDRVSIEIVVRTRT